MKAKKAMTKQEMMAQRDEHDRGPGYGSESVVDGRSMPY